MKTKRNKKYKPRKMSFNQGVMAIDNVLYSASVDMLTDAQIDALTDSLTVNMTALQLGALKATGFVEINTINSVSFHMARLIHESGDDETKAAIDPAGEAFIAAADAMTRIGNRRNSIGRFAASGDDMAALRELLAWYRSLLKVATIGIVTRANLAAAKDVNAVLR